LQGHFTATETHIIVIIIIIIIITVSLVVPSTRRTTLGDRVFPVAAARAWKDLPPTPRASPSLLTFRQQLHKKFLVQTTCVCVITGTEDRPDVGLAGVSVTADYVW